jgi:hypothetical protein
LTFKSLIPVKAARSGKGPVKRFASRIRVCRFVRLEKDDGIEPFKNC